MKIQSSLLTEIISSLLILVWTYAAISKLFDFNGFILVLQSSPLLKPFAYVVALTLPLMELIISFLLLVPKYRLKGFASSFYLLLLLTGYIGYMLLFATNLPCNCGGILKKIGWSGHFFFTTILTGLAAAGWLIHKKNKYLIAINPHNGGHSLRQG